MFKPQYVAGYTRKNEIIFRSTPLTDKNCRLKVHEQAALYADHVRKTGTKTLYFYPEENPTARAFRKAVMFSLGYHSGYTIVECDPEEQLKGLAIPEFLA